MVYGTMSSSSSSSDSCVKDPSRWWVLVAMSLNTALNASLCMTFSTVEETAKVVLQASEHQIANLYSVYLLTTVLGMTPAMYFVDKREATMVFFSNVFNVTCAWQRWQGIDEGSNKYIASVASQVLCGMAAWPIFVLPGQVSHRRFPKEEQTLATSLMLQANYFGWLLGSCMPPFFVDGEKSFVSLLLGQAIIASILGFLVLLFYRRPSSDAYAEVEEEQESQESGEVHAKTSGYLEVVYSFKTHPSFRMQILSHGLLGGISFATPSALYFILDDMGFSGKVAILANFAFISCGVVSGVLLGYFCQSPRWYKNVLKGCYALCAVALLCCALLVQFNLVKNTLLGLSVLIFLVAVAGGTSLGFLGIGIEAAALYPVKAAYVCWAVESLILASSAVLSSLAAQVSGFWVLGGAAVTCALPILCFYEQP